MNIGIMSDSHDHMPMIRRALQRFTDAGVGAVIHAGDFISPLVFGCFAGLTVPFYGVFGNNDGEKRGLQKRFKPLGEIHERFFLGEIAGLKFAVSHEPDVIESLARSGDYDVVVCGHTHLVDVRTVGRALLINPGEVCGWSSGRCSVALLETQTKQVQIIDLA